MISSAFPSSAFLARYGSASSALPVAMISSICAGSFNDPTQATGLLTFFLISAARYTFTPRLKNADGWVRQNMAGSSWFPQDTLKRSTLSSTIFATFTQSSSPSPTSVRSSPEIRISIGNLGPTPSLTASSAIIRNLARFSREPPNSSVL